MLQLEYEPEVLVDPVDELMSDSEFDRELQAAAEGNWDEVLDLDPEQFRPATVQEFMSDAASP